MLLFFILLEVVELQDSGLGEYITDGWNVLDWINFVLLITQYAELTYLFQLNDGSEAWSGADCREPSTICKDIGYWDDWEYARTVKDAKLYLSFNVNIQLLKIIKFMNQLVPKTSLAVKVLGVAAADLVFFSTVFFISILAFSNMFFVQLGPVMEGYWSQLAAIVTLVRALFGDFDIDDILNNSNGYLNVVLFLAYLFVALFIILSIFLTILGEAQAAVSQENDKLKEKGEYKEYGVIQDLGELLGSCRNRVLAKVRPISLMEKMSVEALSTGTMEIKTVDDVKKLMAMLLKQQKETVEDSLAYTEETLIKALTGLGLVQDVQEKEKEAGVATPAKCADAPPKSEPLTPITEMSRDDNTPEPESVAATPQPIRGTPGGTYTEPTEEDAKDDTAKEYTKVVAVDSTGAPAANL